KEQSIRIQASGGLSEAEVEKMVKEAASHADEDKKRRAEVEAKNNAEGLIHATEKSLKDFEGKVDDATKKGIEDAIADLKSAIQSGDVAAITAKTEALGQASMKLGEMAYRKAQEEAAGADGTAPAGDAQAQGDSGTAKPDDVVDADYTDLGDDGSTKH
ncbi:MAG: Hsp70 family protein, partial [Alphaproteobacteria bacterium]|nr:Hsp70 family protein [Alphaproteobacteria bacterium]